MESIKKKAMGLAKWVEQDTSDLSLLYTIKV